MRKPKSSLLILLTFAFGIMLASTISAGSIVVFAQKNQTTTNVAPAGQQATKIINQTSTAPNVTSTNVTTAAKQPQAAPSPTNQTATSPSMSSAGGGGSNQTGNNTSANPLAKVPVIGKLFGGK
jgi:cytoskeletal protein RodZ